MDVMFILRNVITDAEFRNDEIHGGVGIQMENWIGEC